jgi:four helix bundle protein
MDERPKVGLKEHHAYSVIRGSRIASLEAIDMKDVFEFPFEKLEVWHLAIDLADFIISLLELFPQNKHFRLIGQMEAAVSSIAQNIAEGKGRQHKKEFIQFLYVAEGSLFEVVTLTELFKRRGLFGDNEAATIRKQAEVLDRKLHGLINSLRGN